MSFIYVPIYFTGQLTAQVTRWIMEYFVKNWLEIMGAETVVQNFIHYTDIFLEGIRNISKWLSLTETWFMLHNSVSPKKVSDLFLAMWELPQTVACRIDQTLCRDEPKPLNKTLHLLSWGRKEDYRVSRKCLSGMLHSFLSKAYRTFGLSREIYCGIVSLTFLCVQDVKGMVFSYLQKAAEGDNKRLQYISGYFSVYLYW